MEQPFDSIAATYDQWYDTVEGKAIFNAELGCLRLVGGQIQGHWLEVGVGTGRFASNLGIAEGIDPSSRMLEIAAARGIRIHLGCAEKLPFPESSFNGVLMALALCFVDEPTRAISECSRVLRPKGHLLLGFIPADSPWGVKYEDKASKGHPVYASARFRTVGETIGLVQNAGFELVRAASTLFWKPGAAPQAEPQVAKDIVPEAGFIGLLFDRDERS